MRHGIPDDLHDGTHRLHTDGIAFGLFAWIGGKTLMGKYKDITPTLWVLTAVFIVYFFIDYIVIPNGWL